MKSIGAGDFKAQCLALMDEVQQTHEPVLITKRGKPIAKLVWVAAESDNLFGLLKGKMHIEGDIVAPVIDEAEWDCLK